MVDSGLARKPAFDPNTGLTRLETRRISKASALQRAGRAGRLGPGRCYRIWTSRADRRVWTTGHRPRSSKRTWRRWCWNWRTGVCVAPRRCAGSTRRRRHTGNRRSSCCKQLGALDTGRADHRSGTADGAFPGPPAAGACAGVRRWRAADQALPPMWPPCCRSRDPLRGSAVAAAPTSHPRLEALACVAPGSDVIPPISIARRCGSWTGGTAVPASMSTPAGRPAAPTRLNAGRCLALAYPGPGGDVHLTGRAALPDAQRPRRAAG